MGISLINPFGAMPYGNPVIGGANRPGSQPPGLLAADQAKVNQLQAQYGNMCGCANCMAGGGVNADTMLQKIKAESYAHILGHEQAHQSAAGGFGGGINIQYDANGVAIAGHVPISIPGMDSLNPENSLKAYNTIRGAALAPSDPSGQDMAVAAHAQSLMGQAQVLMGQKKQAQSLGIPFEEFRKMGFKPPAAGQ